MQQQFPVEYKVAFVVKKIFIPKKNDFVQLSLDNINCPDFADFCKKMKLVSGIYIQPWQCSMMVILGLLLTAFKVINVSESSLNVRYVS